MTPSLITIRGAGVIGLTTALALAERGATVEILEQAPAPGDHCCSWYAGGMLAPDCETESAEPIVAELGAEATSWWRDRVRGVEMNGSLVVAAGRDAGELTRFARRTRNHQTLDRDGIAALEPALAERFEAALFFPHEGHLEPRRALADLRARLAERGVTIRYGVDPGDAPRGLTIDARGYAARDALTDLRGVQGEMLVLKSDAITLQRPVRLLHPRQPVYIVPRPDGCFMVGATQIESEARKRVSARGVVELLNAAYALHPAFADAEIVELGADLRPAFPDNLPRIRRRGDTLFVNGLFRHGFLLAPACARRAAQAALDPDLRTELMDEDHCERGAA